MKFRVCLFALAMVLGTQANAAPTMYGKYYDETANVSCANSSCRVQFSQTPPDKLIEITNVACTGNTTVQLIGLTLTVAATPGGNPLQRQVPLYLPPPYMYNSINIIFSTNHPVRYLVGQGRYPVINWSAFDSYSAAYGSCHIVGNVVDPIP